MLRILILLICFYSPLQALPRYNTTKLPLNFNLSKEEKEVINAVLALEVHQDSDDPNQYYYIPPFHIRQFAQGAGSMFFHAESIKNYSEANSIIKNRNNNAEQSASEIKKRISYLKNKLIEVHERKDKEFAEFLQKEIIEENLNFQKEINSKLISSDKMALFSLSQTGFDADISEVKDPDKTLEIVKNVARKTAASNGGFLSVNVFAGFSKEQLEALRIYKTKYYPQIKVSLYPAKDLVFFGLGSSEAKKPDDVESGIKIINNVSGAGDYLGAVVVMDTSIVGAAGFAKHLGPFVLPVGIKATLLEQAEPFEAYLDCDMRNGFSIKGRSDVRDGMIIYDNDITQRLHINEINEGKGCNIDLRKGSRSSAELAALETLETKLEGSFLHKTQLTFEEKERYYKSIKEDVENNRRSGGSNSLRQMGELLRLFGGLGMERILIAGLSEAADFHWHTDIRDINQMSSLKFSKSIKKEGYEEIHKNMATELCLIYNKKTEAYDRCTAEELKKASILEQSIAEAKNAPECEGVIDPFDCAKKRDEQSRYLGNRDIQKISNILVENL